jgi:hypothetical protein
MKTECQTFTKYGQATRIRNIRSRMTSVSMWNGHDQLYPPQPDFQSWARLDAYSYCRWKTTSWPSHGEQLRDEKRNVHRKKYVAMRPYNLLIGQGPKPFLRPDNHRPVPNVLNSILRKTCKSRGSSHVLLLTCM